MNRLERRRRCAPLIWLMIALLATPPGVMQRLSATNSWDATMTRDTQIETFHNPMVSSTYFNRFLFADSPRALMGDGGDSFLDPLGHGYGNAAEPNTLWLSNAGRVVWEDADLRLPGIGSDIVFSRVYRGSVASYDGPLGSRWDFSWNSRILNESGVLWLYEMGRKDEIIADPVTGDLTIPTRNCSVVAGGSQVIVTDRYGVSSTFDQSTANSYHLSLIEDLNGNTTEFVYLGTPLRLQQVVNNAGYLAALEYDSAGRITKITDDNDPGGTRAWSYEYSASGSLTKVITPDYAPSDPALAAFAFGGKVTEYQYDLDGRLIGVVLPGDSVSGVPSWEFEYDALGQSGRVTKQLVDGLPVTLTYDDPANAVTVDDRAGDRTIYEYDADALITKRRQYSSATVYHDTYWAYNANAEVTAVTFPRGNCIEYDYDALDNVTEVRFYGVPEVITTIENGVEVQTQVVDPNPITWEYEYGSHSRLVRHYDERGNLWEFEYDGNGNLTKKVHPAVTVPSGIATANNNPHLNLNPDGTIVEEWEYDQYGNVTLAVDPTSVQAVLTYGGGEGADPSDDPVFVTAVAVGAAQLLVPKEYFWKYDSHGNAIEVEDAVGEITESVYDSLDYLIVDVAPGGVTTQFLRDANDHITKTRRSNDTASGDAWFEIEYLVDGFGNTIEKYVDFDSTKRITTQLARDDNARVTKVTGTGDRITEYSYDGRGYLVTTTRRADISADDVVEVFDYDENGCLVSFSDPRDLTNKTVLHRDGYDRVTRWVRPLGDYWEASLDAAGNPVEKRGFSALDEQYTFVRNRFDEANRLYEREVWARESDLITPIGDGWQTTTFLLDEGGQAVAVTGDGPGSLQTTMTYDALGRLSTVDDNLPQSPSNERNSSTYHYDLDDRLTSITRSGLSQDVAVSPDLEQVLELEYDQRGNVIEERERLAHGGGAPQFAVTTFEYGKRDQLTRKVDAAGRVTTYEYNEQLLPTKTSILVSGGPSQHVVSEVEHAPADRRVTYRARNGITGDQITVHQVDRLGRSESMVYPDGTGTTLAYDKMSNVTLRSDANGTTEQILYDGNGRVTRRDISPGASVVGVTRVDIAYDPIGRVSTAATSEPGFSSLLTWSYNTFGLIEREASALGSGASRSLTNSWSESGVRDGVTFYDGTLVEYERDAVDRLTTVKRDGHVIVEYEYVGDELLTEEFADSRSERRYDQAGRVTSILHSEVDTSDALAEFRYTLDASHQVVAVDKLYYDGSGTRITSSGRDLGDQYAYDAARRIVTCVRGVPTASLGNALAANASNPAAHDEVVTYAYDQVGNRTERTIDGVSDVAYAYDTSNRLTLEAASPALYDGNGNFAGLAGEYKYDYDNRIASANVGLNYRYRYDALGRVVQRDHVSANLSVRFYYDGLNVAQQYRYQGGVESLRKTFVYGDELDALVEYTDNGPAVDKHYGVHRDRLGSVALLVDAGGSVEESYRYDEFGGTTIVDAGFSKLSTNKSPAGNPYRFTSRRNEIQLGAYGDDWYDFRARAYRADAGRFVQRDPFGYVDGASLYVYVGNNPQNYLDPKGELFFAVVAVAWAAYNYYEDAKTIVETVQSAAEHVEKGEYLEAGKDVLIGASEFINPVPKSLRKGIGHALGVADDAKDGLKGVKRGVKGGAPQGPGGSGSGATGGGGAGASGGRVRHDNKPGKPDIDNPPEPDGIHEPRPAGGKAPSTAHNPPKVPKTSRAKGGGYEGLAKKLKFTDTTGRHMEEPGRWFPRHLIADVIENGKKMKDPEGAPGAFRYFDTMLKNGKQYGVEVVYRPADNTVLHFLYSAKITK